MEPILSYTIWLKLPPETRHKLSMLFNIPKSGHTVVEYRASGNVVTSDGYTPDDMRAITVEKLQAMLGTKETNFYAMVETVIDNVDACLGGTYTPKVIEKTRIKKQRKALKE